MAWAKTTPGNSLDFGTSGALATPRPYIETDKSSRTAAIFEGISGVLQTAAEAYRRIKYNPQPVPYGGGTLPPDYGGYGVSNPDVPYYLGVERPAQIGISGISPTVIMVGAIALVAVLFLVRK